MNFNTAVVTYLEQEYAQIVLMSEDGHKLEATWKEWKANSDRRSRDLKKMGITISPVVIHPEAFEKYCHEKSLPKIGSTRAQMASELLAKK